MDIRDKVDLFSNIPKCLFEYILLHLSNKNDLFRLACVSKKFQSWIDSNVFWKHHTCKLLASLVHMKGMEYQNCLFELHQLSISKIGSILESLIEFHDKEQREQLECDEYNERTTIRLNVLKSFYFKLINKKEYEQLDFKEKEIFFNYNHGLNEKTAIKYSVYPFVAFEKLWNYYKYFLDKDYSRFHMLQEHSLGNSERDTFIEAIYISSLEKMDLKHFENRENDGEEGPNNTMKDHYKQVELNKKIASSMLKVFSPKFEKAVEKLGLIDIEKNYGFLIHLISDPTVNQNIKIKAVQCLSNKKLKRNEEVCSFLRKSLTETYLRSYILHTLVYLRDTNSLEAIFNLACNSVHNYQDLKVYTNALALILRSHIDIISFAKRITDIEDEESYIVCLSLFSQLGCFQLIAQRNSKLETAKYIEHMLEIFEFISDKFNKFTNSLMTTFFITVETILSSSLFISSCKNAISHKRFKNLKHTLLNLNQEYHKELPLKGTPIEVGITRATSAFVNFYEKSFPEKARLEKLYDYLYKSLISQPDTISFLWYSTPIPYVVFKDPTLRSFIQKMLADLSLLDDYCNTSNISKDMIIKERNNIRSVHYVISSLYSVWSSSIEGNSSKDDPNHFQIEDYQHLQTVPLYKIKKYHDVLMQNNHNQKRNIEHDNINKNNHDKKRKFK